MDLSIVLFDSGLLCSPPATPTTRNDDFPWVFLDAMEMMPNPWEPIITVTEDTILMPPGFDKRSLREETKKLFPAAESEWETVAASESEEEDDDEKKEGYRSNLVRQKSIRQQGITIDYLVLNHGKCLEPLPARGRIAQNDLVARLHGRPTPLNEQWECLIPGCRHRTRRFSETDKLKTHIKTAHLKSLKVQCKTCGKNYANKDSLKKHQLKTGQYF